MVCEHLRRIESEMAQAGLAETFRGRAWGDNCREWVYFDCVIDRQAVRARIALAECVEEHEHVGTHDGSEAGFVCTICKDGVMGIPQSRARVGATVFA